MLVAKTNNSKATQSLLSIYKKNFPEKAKEIEEQEVSEKQNNSGKYDSVSLSAEARSLLNADENQPLFANRSELVAYLKENYSAYKNGSVSISNKYLDSCLEDDEKLAALEKMLEEIPGIIDEIKENLPEGEQLLSANFEIDENGDMKTETMGTFVEFNAAKRAAELAGAMTPSDVGIVLAKLQKDLSDVKAGNCEEKTITLVKRMIRKANEKMNRLKDQERKNGDNPSADAASQIILSSTSPASAPASAPSSAPSLSGAQAGII